MAKAKNPVVAVVANETAAAPVAQKAARTKRAAQPKAPKVETAAAAPAAPAYAMNFVITAGARPEKNPYLFAHTEAFFVCSGFYDGKAIDRAVLVDIVGSSAVSHHTKQGNFEATTEGYKLTEQGRANFKKRKPDPKYVAQYAQIMTTGQADGERVKNQGFIRAVKTV